jgi:hypothetical protein
MGIGLKMEGWKEKMKDKSKSNRKKLGIGSKESGIRAN